MRVTPTTTGVKLQATSAKENPIVVAIVELLQLAPSITAEEAARHSELADGATWRNWAEVPSRIYYRQPERVVGTAKS